MSGADGKTPVAVPEAQAEGKRAGEAKRRRYGAEPAIWTERMLATLETGIRGGKWYSLIDKLYPTATLAAAYAAVCSATVRMVTARQSGWIPETPLGGMIGGSDFGWQAKRSAGACRL